MDIYIDPVTNDIALVDKAIRLTRTVEETTRQRLSITLATFRGEWFANSRYGIPYLEIETSERPVLGKTTQNILDFEIKRAILATEGVTSLTAYTSSYNSSTRKLNIEFSALTESGEIIELQEQI